MACDANCIINGNILFITWRQLKQGVTSLSWSCNAVGTSVSITWHWWYQDDSNKVQHDFFVMWFQCWHHLTLMASSISQLYLFVQDDQNKVQHHFFSHLTLLALALASCDANGIVNSTIIFIRSRQLKQCATKHFWSCYAIDASVSVTWCQ